MTSETETTLGLTEFLLAVAIPVGGWFGKVVKPALLRQLVAEPDRRA